MLLENGEGMQICLFFEMTNLWQNMHVIIFLDVSGDDAEVDFETVNQDGSSSGKVQQQQDQPIILDADEPVDLPELEEGEQF